MSIIPEFIIQQTLVKGLRAFRENPDLVEVLFRNLKHVEVSEIRNFIRDNAIDISVNYPDQVLQLPAIAILLKNENESSAFLGELQQPSNDINELGGSPFTQDSLRGQQTVLGSGSVGTVWQGGKIVVEPTKILKGDTNSVWFPLTVTDLIEPFEDHPLYLIVMEGTGQGQKIKINTIAASFAKNAVVITLDNYFTIIPDTSSVCAIATATDTLGVTGEPSRLFAPSDKIERLGMLYRANYQVDVNSGDQDSVVYLYNIVKAIFVVFRRYLITQGIISGMTMSGGDLAPLQEYFPSYSFRRSLTLSFQYAFDVYAEITEALASQFDIYLTTKDGSTSSIETIAVHTTTIVQGD